MKNLPYFKHLASRLVSAGLALTLAMGVGPRPQPALAWADAQDKNRSGPRVVYHLQDTHESLSAQLKIARKVLSLSASKDIRLVAMEGAEGRVEGYDLKYLAPPREISRAAYHFLKQGYIGAAEYAYFNSRWPFELYGAEDPSIYLKNLEIYRKVLGRRSESGRLLERLETLLDRFPVTHSQQDKEIASLLDDLTKQGFSHLDRFRRLDGLLKAQRIYIPENSDYYRFRRLLQNFSGDPRELRSFKTQNLFHEIQNLIWQLRLGLAQDESERRWVHLKYELNLMKKLLAGELTVWDYRLLAELGNRIPFRELMVDFIREKSPEASGQANALLDQLMPLISQAHEFYSLAELRSDVLADRLVEYMQEHGFQSAILITGGFHTERIQKRLVSRNIQYKMWSPRFAEVDFSIPYHERVMSSVISTIRRESPLKPFEGERESFEAAFRQRIGGQSLGSDDSQKKFPVPRENFGLVFQYFLRGYSPQMFSVTSPAPPQKVLPSFFLPRAIAQEVSSRYMRLLEALAFDGRKSVIYPDILFFVLDQLAAEMEAVDLNDFLAKKEALVNSLQPQGPALRSQTSAQILSGFDSKGVYHFYGNCEEWRGFWKVPLLARLFEARLGPESFKRKFDARTVPYQKGDSPARLIQPHKETLAEVADIIVVHLISQTAEEASLTQTVDEGVFVRSSWVQIPNIPAEEAGTIRVHFKMRDPQEKPSPEKLKQVLEEMETLVRLLDRIRPDIQGARELYKKIHREKPRDEAAVLEHLRSNASSPATLSAVKDILWAHAVDPTVKVGHPLTLRTLGKFIFSPACGLFDVDEQGNVLNWDQVLVAYVNQQVASSRPRNASEALASVQGVPSPSEAGDRYPSLLKLVRDLYLPTRGRGSARDNTEWSINSSFYPIENEMSRITGGQLNALWISRDSIRLEEAGDVDDFVILAPQSYVSIRPFLRLANPTDGYLLFRIANPETGEEKVSRVADPLTRTVLAGFLLAHQDEISTEPFLYVRQTGLPEVDQMDPVRQIHALHEQMRRSIEEPGKFRVIRYKRATEEVEVPVRDEIDETLFEPIRARRFRLPNAERTVSRWLRAAAESLIKPMDLSAINEVSLIRDDQEVQEALSGLALSGLTEDFLKGTQTELSQDERELKIILKSGQGVVLRHGSMNFVLEGQEAGEAFGREDVLGFKHQGQYILLGVLQFLESTKSQLPEWAGRIYHSWRPYLLQVYRESRAEKASQAPGASLGTALEVPERENAFSGIESRDFLQAERFEDREELIREIARVEEGPYRLLVDWAAFKKGALFRDIQRLLQAIPGLKITIVDKNLTGSEIYRELTQRRDPSGILRPYLSQKRLVVPSNPKLEVQLKLARAELKEVYQKDFESFVGVVFNDTEAGRPVSAREMVAKAPRAFRFVARGRLDLGVIPAAAFTLIRGTPQDLFQERYQKEDVWALSEILPQVLSHLLSRFEPQIQLQTSA